MRVSMKLARDMLHFSKLNQVNQVNLVNLVNQMNQLDLVKVGLNELDHLSACPNRYYSANELLQSSFNTNRLKYHT